MVHGNVVVFQPPAPPAPHRLWRAVYVSIAVLAAAFGSAWRSHALAPLSLVRLGILLLFGSATTLVFWFIFGIRKRPPAISIAPRGIEITDRSGLLAYAAWQHIKEAEIVDHDEHSFLKLTVRTLPTPMLLPLEIADDRNLVSLIAQYGGEANPLTVALRSTGA